MASILSQLTEIFSKAFIECGYDSRYGLVGESQRPDLCQFQCNGALAAAKSAKKNPREVAQAVLAIAGHNKALGKLSIAGPGFINIIISDTFLAGQIDGFARDSRCGCAAAPLPLTAVVDYGGPNVAKPMHVGHLRSAIIGQCICNLFKFQGHRVIADNHLGDWGTQMGMLICAVHDAQPGLPYFDEKSIGPYPAEPPVTIDQLEKLYPQANSRCKGDPQEMERAQRATVELQAGRPGYTALWKHFVDISVKRLTADFDRLGVKFDYWYGESFYQKRMEALVGRLRSQGAAHESEGALVVDVGEEGDAKKIPPLLLMKSDGAFLYGTSDLATLDYRTATFAPGRIVYVVDIRQSLHFTQVFRAARIAGIAARGTRLEHAGFGTVNGPDGKPFKTREGNAMQLGDLLDQMHEKAYERMLEAGVAKQCTQEEKRAIARLVGLAALKFADLQNNRESDYVFDLEKFTQFEGKTGPYLLYSAVRIKSILRNGAEKGLAAGGAIIMPSTNSERALMLVMGRLPDSIDAAAVSLAPSILCDWAYTMAQTFNGFYRDCHILNEQNRERQASWLSLVNLALDQIALVLGLLGISIPERM
jgi:arginyl-tRNA synthetase